MAVVEPARDQGRIAGHPGMRWWRPLGVVLLLIALGVAWFSWATFAQENLAWDTTRIGSAVYPQSEWRDGVVLHTALEGRAGPLETGDRVIEIDDVPLADWILTNRAEDFEVGDQLRYTVIRAGQSETFEVTLTSYDWEKAVRYIASTLLVALSLFLIALGVLLARPRDPAARVLFAIAAVAPFGFPEWPLRGQLLGLTLSPWPMWPQLVSGCVWAVVWGAMIPHFALVFPRPPENLARRRWAVPTLYAAPFVVYGAYLAATLPRAANNLERAERVSAMWLVAQRYAPFVILGLLAGAYVRTKGTSDQRRVALVITSLLTAFGVNLVGVQLPHLIVGEALLPKESRSLVFLIVPVAMAVAIVRHHLFDINLVLRRSLLGAGVAGAIGGLYVLSLWFLGHPTRTELPYFLIGTAAALVLPPVYRRLRGELTRRIYGAREDPYALVEQIVSIEPGNDPQRLLQRLARTLSEALRLPYVAISLHEGARVVRASHGTSQGAPHRVALVRGAEEVGFIELDVGHGREPFGQGDQRLLAAIATHAAATVSATMVNQDLQESRARLVASREEERRRIRKDLHDGVGPKLALLSMNLEVIKELITEDPPAARQLIDAAGARAQETISEVRGVVSNLRPAILDELGLEGALRMLTEQTAQAHHHNTERPLNITLEAAPGEDLTRLPAAVEVAAYRIVSEAVNNVSRHSHADQCAVRIKIDGPLCITVLDNGQGISPNAAPGTGITSINERANELGGTVKVRPATGGGTVVTATIPLHHEESHHEP